jgi:CO/xanthine dehydrogenase Mo-binding subunit
MRRQMTRQDGRERVSGQAVYTRDISLSGMLYAKILTCPYSHAENCGSAGHRFLI